MGYGLAYHFTLQQVGSVVGKTKGVVPDSGPIIAEFQPAVQGQRTHRTFRLFQAIACFPRWHFRLDIAVQERGYKGVGIFESGGCAFLLTIRSDFQMQRGCASLVKKLGYIPLRRRGDFDPIIP
jgi:hypothetical protein